MMYKNKDEKNAKTRELRRLWEIEVYLGDPDDPDTETRVETVIAWNAVDAIRRSGNKAVHQPKAVCWVTWPVSEGAPVYRIDSPKEGPIEDEPIVPSILTEEPTEENWGD